MRLSAPSPFILHSVDEDAVVEGRSFRRDRRVMIVLFNVLRDSRHWRDPYDFRLDRERNPRLHNLWFGAGPHYCLGDALANEISRATLLALTRVPGELAIVDRTVARRTAFPGYEHLQVQALMPTVQPLSVPTS